MKTIRFLSLFLVALVFLPLCHAENQSKSSVFPPPIEAMIKQGKGVKFQDKFDSDGGLTGYVLSAANGERRIYYVTPDQNHAILGVMFDAELNNVTAKHQKTYINVLEFLSPGKSSSVETLGSAFDVAMRSRFAFSEGQGTDLYVVFDSECESCSKIFDLTRSRLDRLRIHWIPVDPGTEKGSKWLSVFLQAREKSAVLKSMFRGDLPPSIDRPSTFDAAQQEGSGVLKAAATTTTPVFIYMDRTNAQKTINVPISAEDLDKISAGISIEGSTMAAKTRKSRKSP